MTRIELYARGGVAIGGGEGVDPRRYSLCETSMPTVTDRGSIKIRESAFLCRRQELLPQRWQSLVVSDEDEPARQFRRADQARLTPRPWELPCTDRGIEIVGIVNRDFIHVAGSSGIGAKNRKHLEIAGKRRRPPVEGAPDASRIVPSAG